MSLTTIKVGKLCYDSPNTEGWLSNQTVMSLERFIHAQEKDGSYGRALAELKAGRKTGHWIWWVFPQLKGLGSSHNSTFYGITDAGEALAYSSWVRSRPRCMTAIMPRGEHL